MVVLRIQLFINILYILEIDIEKMQKIIKTNDNNITKILSSSLNLFLIHKSLILKNTPLRCIFFNLFLLTN